MTECWFLCHLVYSNYITEIKDWLVKTGISALDRALNAFMFFICGRDERGMHRELFRIKKRYLFHEKGDCASL